MGRGGETAPLHRLGAGKKCTEHNRTSAPSCHMLCPHQSQFQGISDEPRNGVKLIQKACVSPELWALDSIKPPLLLRLFPLLLCGYLCKSLSLAPGSSSCQHQGLPCCCPCCGDSHPLGPLPRCCKPVMLSRDQPYPNVFCAGQPSHRATPSMQ